MTFDYEGNIEPYEPSQREIINELTAMAKERIKAKDEQRFKPLYQEPTTDNQRTWSYYENLRKTDKRKYIDPKTHAQMLKDATELGDAFRDGDFDTTLGRAR